MRQNEHGEPLNGTELDGWHDPESVRSRRKSERVTLAELVGVVVIAAIFGFVLLKIGGVI
jgi:hypothetical protein